MENIIFKEIVTSTNTEVRQYKNMLQQYDFVALYSDEQTNGRGRRNHFWESKNSDNVYLSIMMDTPIKNIDMITIAIGLSVCEVLEEIKSLNCKIKWPNDLYVNNKKLGGILVETSFLGDEMEYYVIGIGINVNSENFQEVQDIATSIYKETKKKINRDDLIKNIINNVCNYISKLNKEQFEIAEYEKRLNHINKYVYVDNEKVLCKGIDEKGKLIVQKENTEIEKLSFNMISISL